METVDLNKLRIISERKVYKIKYNSDEFMFRTPICITPFGVEKYSGKYVINLEFDGSDEKSAEYISLIKDIEQLFSKIKTDYTIDAPPRFRIDIDKCFYITSIKNRSICNKEIYHHRCHILPTKIPLLTNMKGKYIVADIKLDYIWIHGDTYGLVWCVTDLDINDK